MRKIVLLFLLFLAVSFAQNKTCVYFFYGDGCPACALTHPVIEGLEAKYPNLEVHRFEIYKDQANANLLIQFYNGHNISRDNWRIPAVFIDHKYFIGYNPIKDYLENEITSYPNGVACPIAQSNATGVSHPPTGSEITQLSPLVLLGTVTGAALVDSINPCAITVLLILLTSILINARGRGLLKIGFSFILSVYIAYFLMGLGLLSFLQVSGLSYWFYQVIALFAIVLGLLNLKDYFWYKKGAFAVEIPVSWKPTLGRVLKSAVTPLGAFIIGFFVSLVELPCTGGPYFFTLGLLAQNVEMVLAIPLLLYYNLIFVLPLVIITLALWKGVTTAEEAKEWKDRNKKRMHLITGIVLILLGLVILFYQL